MSRRPLRMMASLIVLWGAYWLYSMLVVPLVEPQAAAHVRPKAIAADTTTPAVSPTFERLRKYLPDRAPELQDPIVLETPNFTLLIKDYKTVADRQVQIKPCTLLFFPDGAGAEGEGRVVVMRAPGGALLDFDEDCDLSRLKVGRLLGGRLVGEVTIRGNLARGEAAGDRSGELHASTRDVQLTPQRIWTPHDVKFQLGNSRGSGSDMQILLSTPSAPAKGARQKVPRGIESFQLLRDVRLTAQLGGGNGALPGPKGPAAAGPQSLEVRCQGAFRFDMIDYVAMFEDQVDVQRINPTGPADALSCELLAIHFARAAGPDLRALNPKENDAVALRRQAQQQAAEAAGVQVPHAPLPAGPGGAAALRRANPFAVTMVEARGNPVLVRATTPQGEADARGEHLQYDVQSGGLMVEGTEPVSLRFGPQQISSKRIRYTPSPDGQSAEALAEGAGRFSGSLPGDPTKRIEATWKNELSLRPHEGKQLLSVVGGAKLNYAELGSLAGEDIRLWLVEASQNKAARPAQPIAAPQSATPQSIAKVSTRYQPHALRCVGAVQIDSPQFSGRMERLEAWFQPAPARAAPATGGMAGQLQPRPGTGAAGPRYEFSGRLAQVQFIMAGERPVLRDVALSGDVQLSEVAAAGNDRPMSLTGDEVQLFAADGADTTLTLTGQPARIAARGMGLSGTNIHYDKGTSRVWIDGKGEMSLLIPGGGMGDSSSPFMLASAPAAAPAGAKPATPVAVQFAQGLTFDGRTARFDGPVVVRSAERTLQTPQMVVRLSEPVDLTRPRPDRKPQLERIDCVGGIVLENRTLDNAGALTAIDRLEALNLSIEQPSGDLKAQGPGWASTIRMGAAAALRPPIPGRAADVPPPQGGADKLNGVKVRFQKGISGNVNRRELEFADDISCVYGPAANWAAQLDAPHAGAVGPDQFILTCDRLLANDLGPAGAAPAGSGPQAKPGPNIELQAVGNARINSQRFAAEGERLIYSTGKQLLTLQGAGQADAQLWQKGPNGETTSHAAAQKIYYWRATNRVKIDGFRNLGHTQPGSPMP